MKTLRAVLLLGICVLAPTLVQARGGGAGGDDVQPMTAAQLAQYKSERAAAQAQWAKLTPEQKAASIASARQKRLADLTAMERYGQNDDMLQETAKQTAQIKAEYDKAKAAYAKLTPQQREALRQSAWKKKRAELTAMEMVGQRNDVDPDVIP